MTHTSQTDRRRQLDRHYQQLRDDSEHCHGCRRPYYHREMSSVGFDAGGRLMMVGDCCAARLVSTIAVSIYYASDLPMPRA